MSLGKFNYVKWGFFVSVVATIGTLLAVPTEIRCSIGLFANTCDIQQKEVEIITQIETGEPLAGVKVQVVAKGAPENQYTDDNGYAKLNISSKGDVRVTLSKPGYTTKDFNINLSNDQNTVRYVRLAKLGQPEGSSPERKHQETSILLPTPTAMPSPKASNMIFGQWVGTYTCAKGITGVSIDIDQSNNKIIADFSLYPVPENPNIPRGLARYEGDFNSTSRRISFSQGTWINRPENWEAYPFHGQFDENLKTFSGEMNGYRCTTVKLKKKDS
jgi:hypothetical protein